MRKKWVWIITAVLLLGYVEAEGVARKDAFERQRAVWKEIEGEEIWRKEMGRKDVFYYIGMKKG